MENVKFSGETGRVFAILPDGITWGPYDSIAHAKERMAAGDMGRYSYTVCTLCGGHDTCNDDYCHVFGAQK